MDWTELGQEIVKIGLPLLGAALPIPGGAALGGALATAIGSGSAKPEDILATLTTNADAVMKAKQFEFQHQETILKLQIDADVASRQADSADISSVNATMQAEGKSEHWAQWSWRPFNGFMFGVTMFGCYFVLPLAKIPVPSIPFEAWTAWGAVLGITAWHRGVAQVKANSTVS